MVFTEKQLVAYRAEEGCAVVRWSVSGTGGSCPTEGSFRAAVHADSLADL